MKEHAVFHSQSLLRYHACSCTITYIPSQSKDRRENCHKARNVDIGSSPHLLYPLPTTYAMDHKGRRQTYRRRHVSVAFCPIHGFSPCPTRDAPALPSPLWAPPVTAPANEPSPPSAPTPRFAASSTIRNLHQKTQWTK